MKSTIIKISILVLILLLGVGGCRKAGEWLIREDIPEHADVMVMLMGSIPDRVLQTADLYDSQVAGRVWIVEQDRKATWVLEERGIYLPSQSSLVHDALVTLGIPSDSISILSADATSTQQEAEVVRDHLLSGSGCDTLLLVSSSTHTRRAYKIFETALKPLEESLSLYSCPSTYTTFTSRDWWKCKDDIQDVIMEYLKFANFVLFEKRHLK